MLNNKLNVLKFTYVDLFSGIGGFRYGIELFQKSYPEYTFNCIKSVVMNLFLNSIIVIRVKKLGLIMMTFLYFEKDRVYQELKIQYFNDAGQYEMALEMYKEINPKAVEQIELIKATQTE